MTDQASSLLATCKALDVGNGVAIGRTFAIFTQRADSLAPPPAAREQQRHGPCTLDALAARIDAASLRILLDGNDGGGDDAIAAAASLTPAPAQASDCGGAGCVLPSFLRNAAASTSHCVVGRGSKAQALLGVLQRPWCVLELCCVGSEPALELLVAFAQAASETFAAKGAELRGAMQVLANELQARRQWHWRRQGCEFGRHWTAQQRVRLVSRLSADLFMPVHLSFKCADLRKILLVLAFRKWSVSDLLRGGMLGEGQGAAGVTATPAAKEFRLGQGFRHSLESRGEIVAGVGDVVLRGPRGGTTVLEESATVEDVVRELTFWT